MLHRRWPGSRRHGASHRVSPNLGTFSFSMFTSWPQLSAVCPSAICANILHQLFGVGAPLRSRSPCASWAPPLHRGLVRGSFPAPHHHDPNEMLPQFSNLGHGGVSQSTCSCSMVETHDHELQARREYPVELDLLLPCSFEACSLMLVVLQRVPPLYGRRPGQPSSSSLARRVCVQSSTSSNILSSSTPSRIP